MHNEDAFSINMTCKSKIMYPQYNSFLSFKHFLRRIIRKVIFKIAIILSNNFRRETRKKDTSFPVAFKGI